MEERIRKPGEVGEDSRNRGAENVVGVHSHGFLKLFQSRGELRPWVKLRILMHNSCCSIWVSQNVSRSLAKRIT